METRKFYYNFHTYVINSGSPFVSTVIEHAISTLCSK
jgi:hypothetical protein